MRPTSILSSEKSSPSTSTPVPNATCSLSAKKLLDVAVQRHHADRAQREHVLRPDLGVVERVEVQLRVLVVAHDLDVELPLREVAALDRLVEVLGGVAELGGLDLGRLRPAVSDSIALLRLPVVLDQHALAGGVDQLVGVDAEAVHGAGSSPGCRAG